MSIYAGIIAQSVPEWHELQEVILYQSVSQAAGTGREGNVGNMRHTSLKQALMSDKLCKERQGC
ncbi:hypothetical protein E05_20650 [Plautia stali symbiont]|nr:hypothetical protein E05_20650 [Plautia stali symbiont]